ncbi:sucrose phosphorylase [Bifidobacterium dolichotidis]|uniref:Sucrose phosphorylase n=1 Tax=Bifidobacterium dolichotidis TaxID=2306976 RepID=A0A430FPV6_9BIFI|nr:sucrose phosphorylase [Bifidobacterium dolichotidis]RSX54824.1 sucrose phosphorylase [Bifidobacterium dolichotidis]
MKNKVQLITYANRLGDGDLASLTRILRSRFDGVYEGVHILPFYTPFDGADAGFDPIDHTAVDERLGDWNDITELSKTHNIMADAIVNHISWQSTQFKDVMEHGSDSEYYPMFLTMSTVFPHGATEADLAKIYRPYPSVPFRMYQFAGEERLVWTTFTPQQVDLNVNSSQGWAYLMSIFDTMAQAGVDYIRLDAVGYGVKEAGTSCFMIPETFRFIERLREEGLKRGLEILIEVHSYYKQQIAIAQKVDRVYDFALPPLLLHTLFTGDIAALAHWIDVRPNNSVNVLDTHDGIGVIDIGPSQRDPSLTGLVTTEDISNLVQQIAINSHGESKAATGTAAANLDISQVNCTYYSALGCDDLKYLAARAVQFFLPGVPQVYYVGALAGVNDMELLKRTGAGRDINRHYYPVTEIDEQLERPVVQALHALARFRNASPAFDGTFTWNQHDSTIALQWTNGDDMARLEFAPASDHVATLTWTDAGGTHTTSNLLDLAPVYCR